MAELRSDWLLPECAAWRPQWINQTPPEAQAAAAVLVALMALIIACQPDSLLLWLLVGSLAAAGFSAVLAASKCGRSNCASCSYSGSGGANGALEMRSTSSILLPSPTLGHGGVTQ